MADAGKNWVMRLVIRFVVSHCCGSCNRGLKGFRPALLLAAAILVPVVLPAQVTTGTIEGVFRAPDRHPLGGAPILVIGGAGFRVVIHTNSDGEFALVLPYGRYQLSADEKREPYSFGVAVTVAPLQTTRVDLVMDASGALRSAGQTPAAAPGLWADAVRERAYPEALSLQGVLLSREPMSVSQPLDFIGLADNRLALESQRAFSWTDTQYKLGGIDATDSYQPGHPLILPDVQALDEVVVRSAFAQTSSASDGTEVGLFLAEPAASWHGALSSADTGSFLASTNLPPPARRGLVQQAERFRWFTRDRVEGGGPLTKWADFFASGAAQWASQAVPLASPGSDQRSRLLFGNARSRIQAGGMDQFDAQFTGSRIDLSSGGVPAGLEALIGRRMAPSFVLPGGFQSQAEVDHLDFVQVGWTHQLPAASGLGALQVRYGYSTAHLDTKPTALADPQQSRIELLGGAVTGAPPLENFAVRTRHEVEGTWQPAAFRAAATRHQIALGGGWKSSSPRNRFTTPSDMNPITANGVAAFVVEFNTPLVTREVVRSSSVFMADHVTFQRAVSLDFGVLADFSRGSLPAQSSLAGAFAPERTFSAQPDRIVWNSVSPRVGFAWQVPHSHGLVVRGGYFRLYPPLAGRYLDFANPNSLGGSEYQWIDLDSDGRFQPGERGTLLLRFGGPYSSISPSLHRPYADEFDVGAEIALPLRSVASIQLFRRDDKHRIAAIDTGVPAAAFTPRLILDPGPDGIFGTFDDQQLIVFEQNPATFGQDRYLLTNPPHLRTLNTGLLAEVRTEWRGLMFHASFVAEKSYGPTNPGDSVFENDPGVLGALFLDPNSAIHAGGRSFMDRGYVGKIQAIYRLPSAWGGIEVASVANYVDGLVFARQLLVSGLAQGPFLVATTVRGSPEGGNRSEYVANWNLRFRREFRLRVGRFAASADVLNVTNAAQRVQENDLSGPSFNLRLPVAIQSPRIVRIQFRYEF